jgi:hypothetical protein
MVARMDFHCAGLLRCAWRESPAAFVLDSFNFLLISAILSGTHLGPQLSLVPG